MRGTVFNSTLLKGTETIFHKRVKKCNYKALTLLKVNSSKIAIQS